MNKKDWTDELDNGYLCKACNVYWHIERMSSVSFAICNKCYKAAEKENPDLDHWDLWELTKEK